MILETKNFKEVCSTVLAATDSSELSTLTETLELKTVDKVLFLNVTNKEYWASVKFPLEHEEEFHAAVNANLFLKLIASITTETVELTLCDTYLNVKANGNYKIPFIMEETKMLDVPEITIENTTVEMKISSDILDSIANFNAKQLNIGSAAKPIQKMFYIDQEGCITFTTGACVNNFTLEKPIRILLNSRIVNLFKLFKDSMVDFSLGYDPLSETIIQTKVSFKTPTITLTAVTGCDDSLLAQVPVGPIRGRANKDYDNKVVLSVPALRDSINRLLLFSAGYGSKETLKPYSLFEFGKDSVLIYDNKKENTEVLTYQNDANTSAITTPNTSNKDLTYSMTLDLSDFKKILDTCNDQFITMNFGDEKACVVVRKAIKNVLPEIHDKTVKA